jgi:hypothetical protein
MKTVKLTKETVFPNETFPTGTKGTLLKRTESILLKTSKTFPISLEDFYPVLLNGKERLLLGDEFVEV